MDYLNIGLDVLRSPEYLGCEPVDRATWLNLSGYCAGQENGGIITDCHEWPNRQWMQIAGVEQAEVMRDCALWRWLGSDLEVWAYPAAQEAKRKAKRENMSNAAGRRWASRRSENGIQQQSENGTVKQTAEHRKTTQQHAPGMQNESENGIQQQSENGMRKGRERKVKEKKDLVTTQSPVGQKPEKPEEGPLGSMEPDEPPRPGSVLNSNSGTGSVKDDPRYEEFKRRKAALNQSATRFSPLSATPAEEVLSG